MTRTTRPRAVAVSLALVLTACGGGGGAAGGGGGGGPPAAPVGFTGSAVLAGTAAEVTLTWALDAPAEVTAVELQVADGAAGPFQAIASVSSGVAGYVYSDPSLQLLATYWYRVRAVGPGGASPWVVIQVMMPAPFPPPDPVVDLAAQATGPNDVALTWTNVAVAADAIVVHRGTSPGALAAVATLDPGATVYLDAGLAAGLTYWYELHTVSPWGDGISAQASVSLGAVSPPPTAPAGLVATPTGPSAISLSWTNTTADATSLEVTRATAAAGPFAVVATLAPTATSWADAGLAASTAYWYAVTAVGPGGSAQTGVVSATTAAALPAPPGAPTGLVATATGATSVTLAWTGPGGTVSGYEVERATSASGPWSLAATPGAAATGWGDTALSSGTTYFYRVRAVNPGGASGWSATASASPQVVAPAVPAAPSGLAAAPVSTSSIALAWSDTASDETGFEIERGVVPSGSGVPTVTAPVHLAAANATSWTDSGLAAGTTYGYRIRAVNAVGASSWVGYATATTAPPPPPAAPTGLTGVQEVVNGSAVVRLAWTDAASDETGYEVERSSDGVTWAAQASLPASSAAWVDQAPLFGGNTYRVRAVNGSGGSAWAQVAVYNGPISVLLCFAPTNVAATATSDTTIHLAWDWPTLGGCTIAVAIERATAESGPWTEVARVYDLLTFPPSPTNLWNDTGLPPGSTRFYRLRSISTSTTPGGSGYTTPVSATTTVTTVLPAPTGLAATVTSSTTARLTWTDTATGEDGFAVDYATAAAGPFTEAFRVGANVTGTDVQGMTAATAYWFRVRTVKGTQASAPSNVVSLTTATSGTFPVTGDASVLASTAASGNQALNFSGGPNTVGCYFIWTVDLSLNTYYFHNCAGSALQFNVAPLAGRTILSARLSMYPCGLAPDPVADAQYAVRALAGPWSPSTVTFNTLPQLYTAGAQYWMAPTAGGQLLLDVTPIVRNWASGAWAANGLFVEQSPIEDLRTFTWGGVMHDWQNQQTDYCSLEQTGGSAAFVPTLLVDYL